MLVCSISQRPRRTAIAADVVEIIIATDATATGNIVFATLVDDPANVRDVVDAYSGEIMREVATATATVNAGLAYATAMVEAASAAELYLASMPGVFSAVITESGTANSVQDATIAAPSRSAMVDGVYINPSAGRQANANGIMINL